MLYYHVHISRTLSTPARRPAERVGVHNLVELSWYTVGSIARTGQQPSARNLDAVAVIYRPVSPVSSAAPSVSIATIRKREVGTPSISASSATKPACTSSSVWPAAEAGRWYMVVTRAYLGVEVSLILPSPEPILSCLFELNETSSTADTSTLPPESSLTSAPLETRLAPSAAKAASSPPAATSTVPADLRLSALPAYAVISSPATKLNDEAESLRLSATSSAANCAASSSPPPAASSTAPATDSEAEAAVAVAAPPLNTSRSELARTEMTSPAASSSDDDSTETEPPATQ